MARTREDEDYALLERAADLDGLEYLRAHYVTYSFAAHTHAAFAIGVVEGGVGAFALGGETRVAAAGSVVAIGAEEAHTGGPYRDRDLTYAMLYPSPALLETVARSVDERSRETIYFPRPVVDDPPLAAELRRLFRVLTRSPETLERESTLLAALAALVARHAGSRPRAAAVGREPRAVALAREYLDANFARNVSLGELSRVAGLSAFRLARAFRAASGLPPHRYLTQRRVEAAKRLLGAGAPAAEVALATGFADQSHLTRHFKRMVGVAPGRYARGGRL